MLFLLRGDLKIRILEEKMDPTGDRYARQRILPELGEEGQRKLGLGSVLIVGCGALGGFQAELLTRAGVGRIRLVDRDRVDWSNLPRQILYTERDAAEQAVKPEAAKRRLEAVNSSVAIEALAIDVGPESIEGLLDGMDVVLDATDNFETRYVLNDACIKHGKPWVYGGVLGTVGMVMPVLPPDGPCLRCLIPDPPEPGAYPTTATAGVLSTAVAAVASFQITAALRILTGAPPSPIKLIHINVWENSFELNSVKKDENCPCCVERKFEFLENSCPRKIEKP